MAGVWAERIGADIIKGPEGGDPAAVAHQTVSHALESNADICILDTAGRYTDAAQMIVRMLERHPESATNMNMDWITSFWQQLKQSELDAEKDALVETWLLHEELPALLDEGRETVLLDGGEEDGDA